MINVLLIDDDRAYYDMLMVHIEDSLYSAKITVHWVEDPSLMPEGIFDIYLVDNRFQGMEKGLECINQIYDMHAKGQIWVVSGYADLEFLKQLFKKRVNGFIDKNDFDFSQLDEIIQAALDTEDIQDRLLSRLNELQKRVNK